ncbi:MAG: chemotaxis protein CheD [Thermodesulfobacteriota bacterium]
MSRSGAGESVVYLQPGECLLTSEPLRVVTVLGSCLAVTFHDPVSGLSAMCHAVFPHRRSRGRFGDHDSPYRFVDEAVARLLERLEGHGVPRSRLEVKVFGGAEAQALGLRSNPAQAVGRLNVKAAFDAMQARGLAVLTSDVGGRRGRTLVFSTCTGEVLLKRQPSEEGRQAPGGGIR